MNCLPSFDHIRFPTPEELDESVGRLIQRDRERWKDTRYTLFVTSCVVEGDYDKTSGTVTDRVYLQISSNDLQFLRDFWKRNEIVQNFDTTAWHYIYDNREGRLIETLSICV